MQRLAIVYLVIFIAIAIVVYFVIPQQQMRYLSHFTLLYSLTIISVGVYQAYKLERKYAVWIAIPIAILLEAAMRLFLVENLGARIESSDPNLNYKFPGIDIISITAIAVVLIAVFAWFRTKKSIPWLIILSMSVVQLLICTRFYMNYSYTR
jgi:hypothetical protein